MQARVSEARAIANQNERVYAVLNAGKKEHPSVHCNVAAGRDLSNAIANVS